MLNRLLRKKKYLCGFRNDFQSMVNIILPPNDTLELDCIFSQTKYQTLLRPKPDIRALNFLSVPKPTFGIRIARKK